MAWSVLIIYTFVDWMLPVNCWLRYSWQVRGDEHFSIFAHELAVSQAWYQLVDISAPTIKTNSLSLTSLNLKNRHIIISAKKVPIGLTHWK